MTEFLEVAKVSELEDGKMKMVIIEGKEFLIAKVKGKYYATQNRCPHMGGNLSQGKLEGTIVTCPRHGSQFDLTDGHVIRWTDWAGLIAVVAKVAKSPRPLHTYEMKMEGENLMLATDGKASSKY